MKKTFTPESRLSLSRDGENVFTEARIALLEQIAATGSITKAGKAVGISYRTAWLTVDHVNNLSEEELVERSQGGKSGGGARLTTRGAEMIKVYRAIEREHAKFLERLRMGVGDFERFLHLTRKIALKTSARNQVFGTVESIRNTGLNAVVSLRLKGKDRLLSQITVGGLESLGLAKGEEAYALIKANWIGLRPVPGKAGRVAKPLGGRPIAPTGTEPENALRGTLVSVQSAGTSREVQLRLAGGNTLVTMIPESGKGGGEWEAGMEAMAVFRPQDVILGVAR